LSLLFQGRIYRVSNLTYKNDKNVEEYKYLYQNSPNIFCTLSCLEWNNFADKVTIHSIKRLSDNEVFAIGDKINNQYTIDRFEFSYNKKDILVYLDSKTSAGGWIGLKTLYHSKQLLFTTEDGKDIYEGDEYYSVHRLGLKTLKNYEYSPKHPNLCDWKRFSTKELAEEYILLNKPCLSINDVRENIVWCLNNAAQSSKSTVERLKELVQNKVNGNKV
jgi:hypothetical protein